MSKFQFVSNFAYSTKFKAQKIKFINLRLKALSSGAILGKSLVKAAAFEASKRCGKIAYNIRDGGKAVLYTVSDLFV